MIREAAYYANMVRGIRRLLRYPRVEDYGAVVREQIEHREDRFLDLARRIVFLNPANPYHEMFRLAGCGYEDLAAAVRRDGLERTLDSLAAAGVRLTHDEFKGKTPVLRSGRRIPATPESFLNPLVRGFVETRSSGSRSPGTPARQSTELQVYRGAYDELTSREFGLDRRLRVQLSPILPSAMFLSSGLRQQRAGKPAPKWFSTPGTLAGSGHYRAATRFIIFAGRCMGARLNYPAWLPENDYSPVARWIAERKKEGRACVLGGCVSPAVRVVLAARENNLDIAGTLLLVGGEALTDARRQAVESAGCEIFPHYIINEVGYVGCSCRRMRAGNRVHVFRDAVAVTARRRSAPLSCVEVNALMFTTLLPFATRFLINAEMDDAAAIEPSACDCTFANAGMNQELSGIYSFGKLTGQGITLMGADVVRVLEHELPLRFGGGPGDYQLVESEGPRQTQLELRVSPRVGASGTAAISRFFLGEVRRLYGGTLAARTWDHSGGFEVVMREPATTSTGKVLPLHVLGPDRKGTHAS